MVSPPDGRERKRVPPSTAQPGAETALSESVGALIGLSLGAAGEAAAEFRCWDSILPVAEAERCVSVAWLMSGAVIRRFAPLHVVTRWRSLVAAAEIVARRQLVVLVEATDALRAAGVEPVVLKGLPLAQRLYGSYAARAVVDTDLYIPAAERASARAALRSVGWTHVGGDVPWEEDFECTKEGRQHLMEVHSSVLSDRLAHFPGIELESAVVDLDGHRVRAQAGPGQVVHLATHLAKHQMAPLLWHVDFHRVWSGLDSSERAAAETVAARSGASKYLQWAIRRTGLLPAASKGDRRSLGRLGYGRSARSDAHGIWREIALAPSPGAALVVAGDWVWPRSLRGTDQGFSTQAARRLRARWREMLRAVRRYP